MKKVFCPIITNEDIGGGIKSTIALLNGLNDLGFDVIVMLSPACNFANKFNSNIKIYYFETEPVISLKQLYKFIKISKYINSYIIKNNLQNDIILCSDRPALMLLNFNAKKHTNILYISRGLPYVTLSAILLKKIVFPYVKQFVGISKRQVEVVKPHLKKNQNITHIYNGVKLSSLKKTNLFAKPIITMVIIGGVCELKNQLQAIQVTDLLSKSYSIELKIYGSIFTKLDHDYKISLENYINKNNIKNIYFMGYSTNLETIFSDADILLSTSVSEGFGRTIIEGMSYGIPVIANKMAGAPTEIIDTNINGILYDGSLETLESNLKKIIDNQGFREKIVENAIDKVKNNFTEEIMAKQYAQLIDKMTYEN